MNRFSYCTYSRTKTSTIKR